MRERHQCTLINCHEKVGVDCVTNVQLGGDRSAKEVIRWWSRDDGIRTGLQATTRTSEDAREESEERPTVSVETRVESPSRRILLAQLAFQRPLVWSDFDSTYTTAQCETCERAQCACVRQGTTPHEPFPN